jgi:CMP-N-acetylneuraminic acid synthetase
MNVAIITARGGSKSIFQKNLYPVNGKPLVAYAARAALDAKRIDDIFIDTDNGNIVTAVEREAFKDRRYIWHIMRPDELRGDNVNHGDVIKRDVFEIKAKLPELQNVVVLLGNTVMVDGGLIDQALMMLDAYPKADSVMSVWQAQDDHPYRALGLTDDGYLEGWCYWGEKVSTNRQTYPPTFFYDQGVWAFRWECVNRKGKIGPWWWMGDVCLPIIREWIAGRDVHNPLDIEIAEWWVGRTHDPKG